MVAEGGGGCLQPLALTQGRELCPREGGLCSSCKTELGLESCGRWRVCPHGQVDAWAGGAAHCCPEASRGIAWHVGRREGTVRSGPQRRRGCAAVCRLCLRDPHAAAWAFTAWKVLTDLQAPGLQMSSLDRRGRTFPKAPGKAARTTPDLRLRRREGEAPRLVCDGPLTVPMPAHRGAAGARRPPV